MNIHERISKLRSLREDWRCLRIASQEHLREYVTNPDIPLEERFQVWIDFCDKKSHERLDEGEVSPIGDWVEASGQLQYFGCKSERFYRGADYDWEFFLDQLVDHLDDVEKGIRTSAMFSDKKVPTVDEFKEILIAENFGVMRYDW